MSGYHVRVTEEVVKIKNLAKEKNTKGKNRVYCRCIKALRCTNENLKCMANETNRKIIMKITKKNQSVKKKNWMKLMWYLKRAG